MVLRSECAHKILKFGSGDYYIFCDNCDAKWAAVDHISNQGIGCTLSGEVREKPSELLLDYLRSGRAGQ